MHLQKVNEALDHRISGGSEYTWTCWTDARWLDYESDYGHASVVFNCKTQEVYTAEVHDVEHKHRPYRWLNPDHKQAMLDEAKMHNTYPDQAWDDVKWYDLETENDWLDKASAIMRGESFDTRIEVPVDLDDDVLFKLFTMAHERDITLNKMVELILQEVINKKGMP